MKEEVRRAQKKQIEIMILEELRMANLMYNKTFANPMEALGVLQEEIFEAAQDWERLGFAYRNLQLYLCSGKLESSVTAAQGIQCEAVHIIQELIQVGAMCQKFMGSRKGWY